MQVLAEAFDATGKAHDQDVSERLQNMPDHAAALQRLLNSNLKLPHLLLQPTERLRLYPNLCHDESDYPGGGRGDFSRSCKRPGVSEILDLGGAR